MRRASVGAPGGRSLDATGGRRRAAIRSRSTRGRERITITVAQFEHVILSLRLGVLQCGCFNPLPISGAGVAVHAVANPPRERVSGLVATQALYLKGRDGDVGIILCIGSVAIVPDMEVGWPLHDTPVVVGVHTVVGEVVTPLGAVEGVFADPWDAESPA